MEPVFKVIVTDPVCVKDWTQDDIQELAKSLVGVPFKDLGNFVTSNGSSPVLFSFGSDGNFQGVTSKINGLSVVLVPGTNSKQLGLFQGPPNSTDNPGPGWEVDATLTKKYFNQTGPEGSWEIFIAKRVLILNNVVNP